MGYAVLAVRILLGLVFTFFGLNFYLHVVDLPKPDGAAAAFMGAVGPSGYLAAVKVFEVTGGILLLAGILVPFGLVCATPVVVNILFYDLFLVGKPGLGLVLLPMALFLVWAYRPYFLSVFTVHARPALRVGEAWAADRVGA